MSSHKNADPIDFSPSKSTRTAIMRWSFQLTGAGARHQPQQIKKTKKSTSG